ncbi:MAG: hypothetical protein LBT75_03260 [Bacilli bacterium]|jgi:hypothetical protein|nr:hypothetical protein [Bacilli bacterium]
MRNKLLVIFFLLLICVFLVQNDLSKRVFINDTKKISLLTNKDFNNTNFLIDGVSNFKSGNLSGLNKKYSFIEKKDTLYCNKSNNAFLVNSIDNIVLYQDAHNIEYYQSQNDKCNLILKSDAFDVDLTNDTIYDNDSIYTYVESHTDFINTGISRINKEGIYTFDNLNDKYSNLIKHGNDVLMIKNMQSVVAFNDKNKVIFKQDNDNNARRVIALNSVGNSLFMIVKLNDHYVIEGYDINNTNAIRKMTPLIKYDISKYYKNYNIETSTIKNNHNKEYVSFTNDQNTLLIKNDFSKIIVLDNTENLLTFIDDKILIKHDQNYSLLSLGTMTKENIGIIRALGLKINDYQLYFSVIDEKNDEVYIKYTLK